MGGGGEGARIELFQFSYFQKHSYRGFLLKGDAIRLLNDLKHITFLTYVS